MVEFDTSLPTTKPAQLFRATSQDKVRCLACERKCTIPKGDTGFCKAFGNIDGELYSLVFGDISAAESRPMEIKPFFHFYPGKRAVTISTWGCNMSCPWCQNCALSRGEPLCDNAEFVSPGMIVEYAKTRGDKGTSISFGEPTMMLDFSLVLFKMARKEGLFNTFVTNGYQTKESLKALYNAGLDAMSIDLKGDASVYKTHCGGADVKHVARNIGDAKKLGIHVEVVSLLVPDINDSDDQLEFVIETVKEEAGTGTPLHFNRYFPGNEFTRPPTKERTLEKAHKMAKDAGMEYVYLGNLMGHEFESTYCPNCGKKVIGRSGGRMTSFALDKDTKCIECGEALPIIGWSIPDWK